MAVVGCLVREEGGKELPLKGSSLGAFISFVVPCAARLLMDARIFDLSHIVVRIDTIAGTDIVSTIYQLATRTLIAA